MLFFGVFFASITFRSSHLFSELRKLCGRQFPPGTPFCGISWGRQCPAANQKVAPSPWDQLQQLQRPRRQVVRLPHATTLRYLARAAGKLLVSCLQWIQGQTGHPSALRTSQSDCYKWSWDTEARCKESTKKKQWKRKWGGVGQMHFLSPYPCSVSFRMCLYCMLSLHTQRNIIHKSPQFRAHSLSKPVPPLSQIRLRATGCNSFISHTQIAHIRVLLNQLTSSPCSQPLTAGYDHSIPWHQTHDTENCIFIWGFYCSWLVSHPEGREKFNTHESHVYVWVESAAIKRNKYLNFIARLKSFLSVLCIWFHIFWWSNVHKFNVFPFMWDRWLLVSPATFLLWEELAFSHISLLFFLMNYFLLQTN